MPSETAGILAPLTSALRGDPISPHQALPCLRSEASSPCSFCPFLSCGKVGDPCRRRVSAEDPWFLVSNNVLLQEIISARTEILRLRSSCLLRCCHFRLLLEGREFTIFTDHKPLTHALFRVLCCGLLASNVTWRISQHISQQLHPPQSGSDNNMADALSRISSFSLCHSTASSPPLPPETISALVLAPVPCSMEFFPLLPGPKAVLVLTSSSSPGPVSALNIDQISTQSPIDFSTFYLLQLACLENMLLLCSSSLKVGLLPFSGFQLYCNMSTGV